MNRIDSSPQCLDRPSRRQGGISLIVALVMLTALGLLAAWGIKAATTNMRVVGNTQARQEAFAAAQAAVERTISSPLFSQQPVAVAGNLINIDVDGDGTQDLQARLQPVPACYQWRPVKTTGLDPGRADDRACLGSGASSNAGIDDDRLPAGGDSLCADSEWNVRATVTDPQTRASVAVNQGVALRGLITDANNLCPSPAPPP